jgi:Dyp-type peroxidase family
MQHSPETYIQTIRDRNLEDRMKDENQKQKGIAFPAPRNQENALIVRLDVVSEELDKVLEGVRKLCTLFEYIDRGIIEMDDKDEEGSMVRATLSRYNFTATIGFAKRFFERFNLLANCPEKLYDMPEHSELGDPSRYVLPQTDILLQILSSSYSINAMVLQNDSYLRNVENTLHSYNNFNESEKNPLDIMGAIEGWAKIIDTHIGFHRSDGRNLMGFHDGISNPDRLTKNGIWISSEDEDGKFVNGTFMVFQKIEHNLRDWHKLDTQEQEDWVGRSKATGLLLGTLSNDQEKKLVQDLESRDQLIRANAIKRLGKLIDEQRNPKKNFFNSYDTRTWKINRKCPVSSHVRRTNSRDRIGRVQNYIFRRGYVYMEDEFTGYPKSGLLFISFQNDIKTFEKIKKNMTQHPVLPHNASQPTNAKNYSAHQKSPSKSFNTVTLGGGYYFIPPIPNKKISKIPEDVFK